MPEIGRWLKTFMCEQYANLFQAYGFKTLHSVCQLQSSTLHSMGIPPEHCDKILENVSVLRQSLAVSSPENGVSQDASLAYNIRQNMQAPRYSGSLGSSYPEHGYDHQLGSAGQANAYAYHSPAAYSQQYNGPNGQVSHNMSYPTNDGYSASGQPHYGPNQDIYGQSMYNNHLHSNPGSWDDPMLLYNHSPRHVMGSSPPATPSPMMRSPPPPSSGPTMVMPHYSRHIMMEPSASAAHHHPAWAHSQGLSPGMVNSPRATPSPGISTLGGIVSPAVCSSGPSKAFSTSSFAPHPPPAHQQSVSYEYSPGPNPSHSRSNVTLGRNPMVGHSTNNANNTSVTPSTDPLQSLQKMVMLEPQNMSNSRPTSVSPGNGQTVNKGGSKFSSVEQLAGCGSPSPSPSYASQKSKTPEASSPSVVSGDSQGKSSVTGMSPPYSPTPSMHTSTSSDAKQVISNPTKIDSSEVCKPSPIIKPLAENGKVQKREECPNNPELSEQKPEYLQKIDVPVEANSESIKKDEESNHENGHMSLEEGDHLAASERLKQNLKEEGVIASCPVSVINGPAKISTGAFREYKERHGSRKFPSHAWDDPNVRLNRRKKWKEQYDRPPMYPSYPMPIDMNGVNSPYNPRTDISLINKTENTIERLDSKGYCDKSYFVDRSYNDSRFGGYNEEQPVSLTNYNRFANYGRNDLQPYGADSQGMLPNNGSGPVCGGVNAQNRLAPISRVGDKMDNIGGGGIVGGTGMNDIDSMSDIRTKASTSQNSFEMDNTSGDGSVMNSAKKKRGRPLGSKNKPKPPGFEKEPRKNKKQKDPASKGEAADRGVGSINVSGASTNMNSTTEIKENSVVTEVGSSALVKSAVSEHVVDSCAKKQNVVPVTQPPPVAVTYEQPTQPVPPLIKKTLADYKLKGPYIHVSKAGKHGMDFTVINTTTKDDEGDSKNKNNRRLLHGDARAHRKMMAMGYNSTLSANYDVFTKDQSWVCIFCHKGSHYRGLGDLYGPYFVESPSKIDSSCEDESNSNCGDQIKNVSEQTKAKRKPTDVVDDCLKTTVVKKPKQDRNEINRGSRTTSCVLVTSTPVNKNKGSATPNQSGSTTNVNLSMEIWVHEDCIIWCHGVYLTGNKIIGLKEAIRMTSYICSCCQEPGATLGCLQKGCPEQYHYLCATDKGCELREDHFCMLCPNHKQQP